MLIAVMFVGGLVITTHVLFLKLLFYCSIESYQNPQKGERTLDFIISY